MSIAEWVAGATERGRQGIHSLMVLEFRARAMLLLKALGENPFLILKRLSTCCHSLTFLPYTSLQSLPLASQGILFFSMHQLLEEGLL